MRKNSIFPLVASTVVTGLFAYFIKLDKINLDNMPKLIDVSINIAGILLGFLITLHGILVSMRGGRVMKILKQANSLSTLNGYLQTSISASAFVLTYCLTVLIFDFKKLFDDPKTEAAIFLIWIFLIVFMAVASFRFISNFIAIVTEEDRQKPT